MINRHGGRKSQVIAILQDIQEELGYLPEEELSCVAEMLELPLSRLYSLATFYRSFTLEPRGKHLILVCMGTACHVRGSAKLVEKLERDLGIKAGQTTGDGMFTLETANCLGACALGPLVVVDGEYHGQMNAAKTDRLLEKMRKKEKGS